MKKKQAISLIVLVITIIVMIILAGAIILTLSNNGIIDKASETVELTDRKQVETMAQVAWAEAYAEGATTKKDIQDKIDKKLDKEIKDKYIVEATEKGVYVTPKSEWITTTVDGVPIPKGFVASSATGENTKAGGLVIYEGTDPVTNENVEDAKRERNQYVWVPVEDFTKFVRTDHINNPSRVVDANGNYFALGSKDGYWEVLVDEHNMPLDIQDLNCITSTTLAEAQAMYASVKEYKGFYIARYEAGIDAQRSLESSADIEEKIYSTMGKIPYTYIPWTKNDTLSEDTNGAVQAARSIYPENNNQYGVVSSLTYAVQWDRVLAWWNEVNAKDGKGRELNMTDSTAYGNYGNSSIVATDLNAKAKYAVNTSTTWYPFEEITANSIKPSGTWWLLTTGALEAANVNNIYDMAGNIWEYTMEGAAGYITVRSGACVSQGNEASVSHRNSTRPNEWNSDLGFRAALYIKL